jgi:hypothetical protein
VSNPVEIWLRLDGLKVICSIVNPDESVYRRDVESLSLRGAQREISGFLIGNGLRPESSGWVVEAVDKSGVAVETWRRFTPPTAGQ